MPLVRITVARGLSRERLATLSEGVHRAPLAFVQVFMNVGRTVEVKKALYAALADAVAAAAPIRREDVIVNLVEVARENWSFGGGVMSYPPQP